jgi:hypothetical protein
MLIVEDEIKRAPAKPTRSAGCHPARDSGDSPGRSAGRQRAAGRKHDEIVANPYRAAGMLGAESAGREGDELRGLSLSAIASNRRRAT